MGTPDRQLHRILEKVAKQAQREAAKQCIRDLKKFVKLKELLKTTRIKFTS